MSQSDGLLGSGNGRPVIWAVLSVAVLWAPEAAWSGQYVLEDIPSYEWYEGCTPTAATSVLGYWDLLGYDNLLGASGSAVYSTDNVKPEIRTLADLMHTDGDGWTHTANVPPAIEQFSSDQGYGCQSSQVASPSFSAFRAEIDAGRPVILAVDTSQPAQGETSPYGSTDHSVPAFGYDTSTNTYAYYQTDENGGDEGDILWAQWRGVGNDMGVGDMVTVSVMQPFRWTAGTDDWKTGGNWNHGSPPGASDPAEIDNGGTALIRGASGHAYGRDVTVGYNATGHVEQTFGGAFFENLILGRRPGARGTYDITDGLLDVAREIRVGPKDGGGGVFTMGAPGSGANETVTASRMIVGFGDTQSALVIEDPTFVLSLSPGPDGMRGLLYFGEHGGHSVPEHPKGELARIILNGDYANESRQPENFSGLRHTELYFPGDNSGTFEVCGLVDGGFTDNFALGKLTISDGFDLKLVDGYDNGRRGTGRECACTGALEIAPGSSLDLAASRLYVVGNAKDQFDDWIADGRLFSSVGPIQAIYDAGHDWTYVTPEPATFCLLLLGGAALVRRRRA